MSKELKQVRVNIRTLANMSGVRKEKINGRDVVIVPSATLPDDVVMNEIQYPADEIEASYASLARTPAPLGHPTINNKFVSARDPEGINLGWIGAWNDNIRRENGRVFLDKIIDVERANETERGKAVLDAIEKGEPIHTSTGLLCNLEAASGAVDYKFIARNIEFDHDAILLDEEGAATPEQGVGMLVNSKDGQSEIAVINSFLEDADREMDWAVESIVRAAERKRKASAMERMKTVILEAIGLSERETTSNTQEDAMSKEELEALSKKVDTLSEGMGDAIGKAVGEAVTNAIKPLVDAQEQLVANQKAKDEAELTELREKIVKANLMDEDGAKELTLNAARSLAKKAEPGKAAPLNAAFGGTGDDKPAFKLPKAEG